MKRVLAAGVAALVLGGCASGVTWTKPGMTESGYTQDVRECNREADRVARADGKPGHQQWATHGARHASTADGLEPLRRVEHEHQVASCMTRKGYEKGA